MTNDADQLALLDRQVNVAQSPKHLRFVAADSLEGSSKKIAQRLTQAHVLRSESAEPIALTNIFSGDYSRHLLLVRSHRRTRLPRGEKRKAKRSARLR